MTRMPEQFFAAEAAPTALRVGAPSGANKLRFHSCDLRKGRWSAANQAYLVTTVTHRRERLFEVFPVARAVVSALRHSEDQGLAHTHAYVLMPDHLHWLMTLGGAAGLARVIGLIKGYSARRINLLLGRQGIPVWQHGYHDHALRADEDFREVARYIVANPLRAGLVERVGDYPWWDAEWL